MNNLSDNLLKTHKKKPFCLFSEKQKRVNQTTVYLTVCRESLKMQRYRIRFHFKAIFKIELNYNILKKQCE